MAVSAHASSIMPVSSLCSENYLAGVGVGVLLSSIAR